MPVIIGAAISFRIANFPDIGIVGSYMLGAGGIVFATQYLDGIANTSIILGIALSLALGLCAGALTAMLYIYARINALMCGIVTFHLAYGISFFLFGERVSASTEEFWSEVNSGVFALLITVICCIFFSTRYGLIYRFAGESSSFLVKLGGWRERWKYVAIVAIGNGLVAVSSALIIGIHGSANISKHTDVLFLSLVSLVIGEGIVMLFRAIYLVIEHKFQCVFIRKFFLTKIDIYLGGSGAFLILFSAGTGAIAYQLIYVLSVLWFGATEFIEAVVSLLVLVILYIGSAEKFKYYALAEWKFVSR